MKSLIIIPLAMLLSLGASAAVIPDGRKSKTRSTIEIKELFKTNINKLHRTDIELEGKAVALVEIDSIGNAKIIECNGSSKEMLDFMNLKLTSKQFINLRNETIKLEVEYRK